MTLLGIDYNTINALYLAMAIMFISLNKYCMARKNRGVAVMVLITIAVGFIKMSVDTGPGSRHVAFTLMSAPIVFGCFPTFSSNKKFWDKASKIMFRFFLFETFLAIFERVTLYNVFPWGSNSSSDVLVIDNQAAGEFRSFGLLGHPLQNALSVCTMMAFILCSKNMKGSKKALLWLCGYFAIFCFNTRSSMVGAGLIMGVYVLKEYISNKKISFAKKNVMLVGVAVGIIAFIYAAIHFNIGSRLFALGLFDEDSSQVRVNTWNIFDYYDLASFLFGITQNQIDLVLFRSGIWTTENFWIDYMMSIGLIGLGLVILGYTIGIRKLYHGYRLFDVHITLASFLLIASTNNSLSASWIPLFIYMMTISSFSYNEIYTNKI